MNHNTISFLSSYMSRRWRVASQELINYKWHVPRNHQIFVYSKLIVSFKKISKLDSRMNQQKLNDKKSLSNSSFNSTMIFQFILNAFNLQRIHGHLRLRYYSSDCQIIFRRKKSSNDFDAKKKTNRQNTNYEFP